MTEKIECKITFVDIRHDVITAINEAFANIQNVDAELVPSGDLTNVKTNFDCIITSGNSYGLMDGGFDDAVRHYFGVEDGKYIIEDTVQHNIRAFNYGFLPVGSSFITSISDDSCLVCYSPTMEIPKFVGPRNVYNAFYGALTAIASYNKFKTKGLIEHAICSIFCTQTGGVHPRVAAYMMALAYTHISEPIQKPTWSQVILREKQIKYLEESSLNLDRN